MNAAAMTPQVRPVDGWRVWFGAGRVTTVSLTTSSGSNSSTKRSRNFGDANFNVAVSVVSLAGRGVGWDAWCESTFPVRV